MMYFTLVTDVVRDIATAFSKNLTQFRPTQRDTSHLKLVAVS